MSSGFVSGGTTEEPAERDQEWHDAQRELEEQRQRKAEEGKQEGGKSLYEVLQQNKAAKQEAFEESIRLKNQFRTLDEDEVEFLDSLMESTREKEAALKKETTEQLEVFHRQRQEAEKAVLDGGDANGSSQVLAKEERWEIPGRKRRRPKEKDALPGVKLRKFSSEAKSTVNEKEEPPHSNPSDRKPVVGSSKEPSTSKSLTVKEEDIRDAKPTRSSPSGGEISKPAHQPPAINSLGLGAYDSDDD